MSILIVPSWNLPVYGAAEELREQKGWSKAELCKQAGISREAYRKWKTWQNTPRLDEIAKVFRALDHDLHLTITPR